MSRKICIHLIIRGRVQGVFFRASARDKALEIGVKGWVRNLPDDSVEAMAEGDGEKIKEFIAWCRQGPPKAKVTKVEEEILPFEGQFQEFSIRS